MQTPVSETPVLSRRKTHDDHLVPTTTCCPECHNVNNRLFAIVPPTLKPVHPYPIGATICTMYSSDGGLVSVGRTSPNVTPFVLSLGKQCVRLVLVMRE